MRISVVVLVVAAALIVAVSAAPSNAKNEGHEVDHVLQKTLKALDPCKGVIFVGEMTEVIGEDRKVTFLNMSRQLSQKLSNSGGNQGQMRFSIAMFGDGIYRGIQLQKYADFDTTVAGLIQNVTDSNSPNGARTRAASILRQLYTELGSIDLSHYMVLFMGESETILDYTSSFNAASKVGAINSNVYVLSMTMMNFNQEAVFKAMVNGDSSRLYHYTNWTTDQIAAMYEALLTPIFSNWSC